MQQAAKCWGLVCRLRGGVELFRSCRCGSLEDAWRIDEARRAFDLRGRRATKQREALEAIPAKQRTREDYSRVLDAYREVYHANPGDKHAAASVSAVAELFAEQGRDLADEKSLKAAVGQYEFRASSTREVRCGVGSAVSRGPD